ncbi:hypothetical protein BDF20DRAFT_403697 [Mycotypha africana]|uniref:uncharacterized protein n=1 Tax=Mycotypha africana TaxID=64632 RepID=UPI0022FFE537|nr:uncharacterized protein BDF20DRAFT_403697 [Mycotypha africana]KAI8984695.1 hypothetical protein BDF20DRAFT_403697 [Mycotypha africana]
MQGSAFFTAIAVAALATVSQAAPMAKRGESYSGTATWYAPATQGGPLAACNGEYIHDESPIVALNADQYGNLDGKSDFCGKKIRIQGPAGTATATILDACPECSYGDLDLTSVLFKKVVGDKDKGVGAITWEIL